MSAAKHRKNAKRHALKRAQERFDAGPELLKELRRRFKRQIKRDERVKAVRGGRTFSTFMNDEEFLVVFRGADRIKAHIYIDGTWLTAVYDKRLNVIVTVYSSKERGGEIQHEQEKVHAQEGGQRRRLLADKGAVSLQAAPASKGAP